MELKIDLRLIPKRHIIVSVTEHTKVKLNDVTITNSKREKLLDII